MPSYSVSYDHNSATFNVTGLSSGNIVRIVLRPASTNYLLYRVDYKVTSTSLLVTIPDDLGRVHSVRPNNTYSDNGCVPIDLTPETDYVCRVYVFTDATAADAEENPSDLGANTFATSKKPDVEEWSWTSTNGPKYLATAAQTQQAYTAVTSKGHLSDFSYLVWNDLVYKANEVVTSLNESWDTTYGDMGQTLMTSSDKVLTAKRFNALRYNVGLYASTGIGEKTKGDTVMGSYFITIAASINKAITSNANT